jgi:hypothetical protein
VLTKSIHSKRKLLLAMSKNHKHGRAGLGQRNMPEWYDSNLHYGLGNVANPANLSFGLLRTPSLNRQHIPFHLQKESCIEATIVAEKVLKNMNLIREGRLRSASDSEDCMVAASGSALWTCSPQNCCVDSGMAQWSKSSVTFTPIPGASQCKCNALKLLRACKTCDNQQACRLPIDSHSDDEIDRAFELIKLRRENMPLGVTPIFSFRRKTSAERQTHAGVPRQVLFGKFSTGK